MGIKIPPLPVHMRVNIRENQIKMKRAYEIVRRVYLGICKQLGEKTKSFALSTVIW